jgi:hypothetical protein
VSEHRTKKSSPAMHQWDHHYANLSAPEPYGDSPSYRMAAEWMHGCITVEDWGCGKGWLRSLIDREAYLGVDGSKSPFADVVDDLATRITVCDGIVLRHVLEHCDNWADVLDNAVRSAIERLCIVLFTPVADQTHVLAREPEYGDVPVISFALADLTDRLEGQWTHETFESPQGSVYRTETVIRVTVLGSTEP